MKKTFPVNINGSIFYIDEDAYHLLNTYLDQLRSAFPGNEGKEIISDIEGRIAEHFDEIIAAGSRVINIDDTNRVIEQMGRPGDLSDASSDEAAADPQAADSSSRTSDTTPPPFNGSFQGQNTTVRKRLYRDERNKVFGGVLSGLACYFGWSTNILRVLVIIIALFTKLLPLCIVYMISWMVIPPARTPRQILEMTGTPVNISSLGQTILGSYDGSNTGVNTGFLQTALSILGKIILIFAGICGGFTAIGFLVLLIMSLCGLILYIGWGSIDILDSIALIPAAAHPVLGSIGVILLSIAVVIPCIAIIWGACCAVFKVRSASKTVIITTAVLELILIVATIVTLSIANIEPSSVRPIADAGSVSTLITGTVSFFSLQLS